ncbi:nucleoporin 50kDa [Nesidiocoris tenuis]|uniref:Nucleoporin 50kDa n=1 Tax=Nesidiocoris tenuis TaxID=355587 RepID=A0ABN7B6X6_9HEMI|nr:nucleoporin 50kDa [Nesidiocoris tenuis]
MLKRAATNELNHENWDQEEEEEEPSKEFKMASSDVLSKRVFKRGKRRLAESTSQAQPSPFATFSFGSASTNPATTAAPSSSPFSFLADVKKSVNGDEGSKTDVKPQDDEKDRYLSKLRGLNEEFLSWISKHIEKNAYCILTPCFEDYTKYLEKIQKERDSKTSDSKTDASPAADFKSPMLSSNKDGAQFSSGFFSNVKSSESKSPDTKTSVGGSIFGNSAPTPFSFGNGKPFTFSSTGPLSTSESKPPAADDAAGEESDEPPKNEFNLVKEDDAVFSQRVKVFVKKDKEDYTERGVGTLYVKPVNDKFQVVVRADTSLGNLLVNIVLTESMPMKRLGKNNVLLVCVPVPGQDAKPIPTLLRSKTKEAADKLFEELEKCKK